MLVNAEHIGRGRRIPLDIRSFIAQNYRESSVPVLSEMVLDRFGVVLGFETVQRWARKASRQAVLAYSDADAT